MADKVTKSSPLVAAILRSFIRGSGNVSLPAARRLGRGIGSLLWRLPNRFRDISFRNVDRCFPELDERERRRIVRQSLISTGLCVAEAGAMFHWPVERLRDLEEDVRGSEVFEAALSKGKGVITLAPHLGNWEFLSHMLTLRHPIVALYRQPRIAEFDAYLRDSRQRFGSELVPVSASGLRRILRTLAEGGVVGILPDQEPLKRHGVFAPFFGIPALTMTLVGELAHRFQATVIYGLAERTVAGGFRIHVRGAPEEVSSPDPIRSASALNEGVERLVREFPEQYIWSYRRFRTRPPEELATRGDHLSPVKKATGAR